MVVLPDPVQRLAARQFGVTARYQLLRWLTDDQIRGLVRRRLLVPIERGVYRVAGGAIIPAQAPMAAALRARPRARVTGPFVLGLFDVDGFTTRDRFEILCQPGRRLRGVTFPHRPDPFPNERRTRFAGMPITDPTASLVDSGRFAAELGERRLRVAYDWMRWHGMTSRRQLERRMQALGREDPGAAFFFDLREDFGLVPESEAERLMGPPLRRFAPEPEPQVWVTPRRRTDWWWRGIRLALDFHGNIDHGTAAARQADRDRDGELERVGARSVTVVAADLDDVDRFVAWVEHLVAVRAYELGVAPPRLVR